MFYTAYLKKEYVISLAIFACGILLYYCPMLNNIATPGGDGGRIFPFLQFVDNAESFYPLWNPYKLGGVPTLADPERFIWLSKLIDTGADFANLQLNILFIIVMVGISFSAYLLARELKISQQGALIIGIVLPYSWFFTRWIYCGRISVLLAFMAINFALLYFVKYLKSDQPFYLILTGLMAGLVLSTIGYYAGISLFPTLISVGWYYNRKKQGCKRSAKKTVKQISYVFIVGLLSFSVFLLPMIQYLLGNYASITLPRLGSLPNVFVNIKELGSGKPFPFISTASLPLITLLFINRRELKGKPTGIFLAVVSFCLVFFLGRIYPFKFVVDIFEHAPVLNQIRHSAHFNYLFTFSITFLLGYGFDTIDAHNLGKPRRKIIPLLVILLVSLITIILDITGAIGRLQEYSLGAYLEQSCILNLRWKDSWKYIMLLALFIFPYTALKKKKYMKGYIVLLIVIQVVFFKTHNDVKPVNNKAKLKKIATILNEDKSYYRIWDAGHWWTRNAMGMPKVRALNGFSLYFSNEHRWQLENLLQRKVVELRPHWVNIGAITDWNENVAKLSNLKYVISNNRKQQAALEKDKNWLLVGSDKWYDSKRRRKRTSNLYLRNNWESALRVFDNWEVIPEVNGVLEKMRENDFDPFEKVFIEKTPAFASQDDTEKVSYKVNIHEYSEEEISIGVTTVNKNGILFIPEYYDDGWKATVDGEETPVIRANASFRGIPITEGSHLVKVYYAPQMFYIGLFISIITILMAALFSFWEFKKRISTNVHFENRNNQSNYTP